ncbi:hypothetical protein OAO01_00935 [Oligoflexia bacterium]|nr:hypothetical protein [Oligoflexia bacterium]
MNSKTVLNDSNVREISKRAAVSPNAARRLLGSCSVTFATSQNKGMPPEDLRREADEKNFDLGLRLNQKETFEHLNPDSLLGLLAAALKEYGNTCPVVYNWLVSGGFNPTKRPARITLPILKHASITSGRLRAKVLRQTQSAHSQ